MVPQTQRVTKLIAFKEGSTPLATRSCITFWFALVVSMRTLASLMWFLGSVVLKITFNTSVL